MLDFLAQRLTDVLVYTSGHGFSTKAFFHAALFLRFLILFVKDPEVSIKLEGMCLRLPLSHDLPIILRQHPAYSHNVGRVVSVFKQKYSDLFVVDIGANIGDSVAIIRGLSDCPILCIEGDEKFYSLLKRNVAPLEQVYVDKIFVGRRNETRANTLMRERGTARILDINGTSELRFQTLAQIFQRYPQFSRAKFIKIDTDGYDLEIIYGAENVLTESRSAIFFEYSPFHFENISLSNLGIFDFLESIGYDTALVWDNVGDFLMRLRLRDKALISDLHEYFSGRGGMKYADICVFHREDSDLIASARDAEVDFFRNLRMR